MTDHQPLKWMMNVKDPGSRILRWRLLLEEYDFEVVHKAGKRHVNEDCLSRITLFAKLEAESIDEDRKIKLIKEMHECPIGGHQGIQRTYERLKLYCNWPNMFQDINEYIQKCKICQINKIQRPIPKAPLQITDTPREVWEKIAIDIVGPLTTTLEGNKYILTCQDMLSKYLIAIPMQDMTTETIAQKFAEHIILQFGVCDVIFN